MSTTDDPHVEEPTSYFHSHHEWLKDASPLLLASKDPHVEEPTPYFHAHYHWMSHVVSHVLAKPLPRCEFKPQRPMTILTIGPKYRCIAKLKYVGWSMVAGICRWFVQIL